jgi:hypothetical protein
MEILFFINAFGYRGGDIIYKRQTIYESLTPCIDNQAAMIRIFNAIPGLTSIDFYLNDVPRILNVEYRELTDYVPTSPGPRNIKVYQSKSDNLLLELENLNLIGGQMITDVYTGSLNNIKFIRIIDDINERVLPDETKIRFYNLDASPITFSINPAIGLASRVLNTGGGTNYTLISPGNYNLEFRSDNQTVSAKTRITLKPGRIYTVYFIGSADPNSPNYAQINIPQVVLVVDGNTFFHKCIWL